MTTSKFSKGVGVWCDCGKTGFRIRKQPTVRHGGHAGKETIDVCIPCQLCNNAEWQRYKRRFELTVKYAEIAE
jgi:hypothetical protein